MGRGKVGFLRCSGSIWASQLPFGAGCCAKGAWSVLRWRAGGMDVDGEPRGVRQARGEDVKRDFGADLQAAVGGSLERKSVSTLSPDATPQLPAPSGAPGRLPSLRTSSLTGGLQRDSAAATYRTTSDGAIPIALQATGDQDGSASRQGAGRFAPTVPRERRLRKEKSDGPGTAAAEMRDGVAGAALIGGAAGKGAGRGMAAKAGRRGGRSAPRSARKEKKASKPAGKVVALDGSGKEPEKPRRLRKGVSFSELIGEIGSEQVAMDLDRRAEPDRRKLSAEGDKSVPTGAGATAGIAPPSLAEMDLPLDYLDLDLHGPARLPLKEHVGPLAREEPFDPDSRKLLLFQFPSRIPDVVGHSVVPPHDPDVLGGNRPGRLHSVPSGRMGKLRIHRSGKMMLYLGNLAFDVSRGKECSFYQFVADLHTDGGPALGDSSIAPETAAQTEAVHALYALGEVHDHFKVCPSVELLVRQAAEQTRQYGHDLSGRDPAAGGRSGTAPFRQ